ncbi:MAG TPA: hypothetical protein VFB76_13215 [Candidatus Angelobacter sp.]|nr:hypothetical protein [Candidatus Angelobacter sp.]
MQSFYQVVQSHPQLRPIAPASSGTSSGLEEALREAAIPNGARGTATELDTATERFLWSGCCSLLLPGKWWRTAKASSTE